MEKISKWLFALAIAFFGEYCQAETTCDTLFVYLKSGGFEAFPKALITSQQNSGGVLRIRTIDGNEFTYRESQISDYGYYAPTTQSPVITSFKYNNKYNDQLHTDAEAVIEGDSLITVSVGAIGRWLTPSFQLSDDDAELYLDDEPLKSKVSRYPVKTGETYTVARSNERIFTHRVLTPPVWGNPAGPYTFLSIPLTIDMLSTNAPSNYDEGLDKIIDGDPNTFFHSTWGDGQYQKLPLDVCPYIDFALDKSVQNIRFSYLTRADQDRTPTSFEVLVSNNGNQWFSCKVLTTDDGMPLEQGAAYTSPVIALNGTYSYLRFKMLSGTYKNYLCLAEFLLEEAIPNDNPDEPVLIDPGEEDYVMMPYGRSYRLQLNWLADQHQVPRIDINTDNNQMISSKEVYLDATITIDGKGVFPSLDAMPVQIKGRGNTSWSDNPWDKNPYRLKFAEKQKPLGLAKGKNWVLQANKQRNSMMSNAVGMKIARLVGTAAANHVTPVELYINGNYRGSYNLTEKVGFSNNSVDLDDESAATLLELDTYYDEDYKFRTNFYSLPVNIHEPDFSKEETTLTLTDIKNDFNAVVRNIYQRRDISDRVDATMLGRFLMVNELIDNYEIQHPKSTFLYRANLNDPDSKWIFGPVWDLDWAYGYEHNGDYCTTDGYIDFWNATQMESVRFIKDLRYNSGTEVDKAVYRAWHDFVEEGGLQETLEFIDDYFTYSRSSFEHNAQQWEGEGNGYAEVANRMKSWIENRAHHVYSQLTPYDLTEPEETNGVISMSSEGLAQHADCVSVYDLGGHLLMRSIDISTLKHSLPKGIYVLVNNNGKSRKYINK